MTVNCYITNYIYKVAILIFLNLICLCSYTNIYAGEILPDDKDLDLFAKNENFSNKTVRLSFDPETQFDTAAEDPPSSDLVKYIPKNKLDKDIFYSLDRILHKDGFDLKNGRWWLLKALLYAPTPFFCGANTLIIAKTSTLTAQLILAAQFTVPRTIESICNITDRVRLAIFEKRLKIWWQEKITKTFCPSGMLKLTWTMSRLIAGVYLGYAYSIIDAQTAGDAYRWIYEDVTSNEKALDVHDNIGYAFNFSYTAMLGAIFFIQLIDEFATKSSFIARTIYNSCQGKQTENQDLEYEMLEGTIIDLRSKTELVCSYDNTNEEIDYTIEEYLSDRGLNSIYTIASLQKYLGPENKPSSITANISSNLFKLFFIAGATVLCGVSFKYIFASRTILRNYVDFVGDKQSNGSYIFNLKDGGTFLCNSVDDCTTGVDFNKIDISDNQKDKLLELNTAADLANILQGIGISADTAVLILSTISLSHSMTTSYLHRRALKIGWLKDNCIKTSKVIALIGAALILPSMVFYLDNVNDVRPTAKTANRLLESTGQDVFIPVDLGIVSTLVVLGATFSLGARLLSNLPYAIYSAPKKIRDLPRSATKIYSNILRMCK